MMFNRTAPSMFSLPNAPWHTNKYVMCPRHKMTKAAQMKLTAHASDARGGSKWTVFRLEGDSSQPGHW
jgi:hypothetical protein